jgi:hypothetical protein
MHSFVGGVEHRCLLGRHGPRLGSMPLLLPSIISCPTLGCGA